MQRLPKKTIRQRIFVFRAARFVISFLRYICGRGLDSLWPKAAFAKSAGVFSFRFRFSAACGCKRRGILLGFVRDHVRCLVR